MYGSRCCSAAPMVASKHTIWNRHAILHILWALLFLSTGGAARVVRFTFQQYDPSLEVAEVVHRQLQTASYCVAMPGADTTQLQTALDWACGPGNADCSAIQEGGSCYNPNTVAAHASYAFDSYYYKQSQSSGSCSFGGLATVTATNPSSGTCVYPSSSTSPSSSLTPTSNTTTFTPPTPSTNFGSPTTATGTTSGVGPSASSHFIHIFFCALVVIVLSSRL